MNREEHTFYFPPPDKSISKHIDMFLQTKSTLKTSSQRHYYYIMRKFYEITQTDLPQEEDVANFLDHILKEQSEKSYNTYLGIVKMYIRFLERRELVGPINYLEDYKSITSPKKVRKKKAYSEEEISEFLKARPRWFHYFLFLAFYFGFRPVEITRLKVSHFHMDELYIDVPPEVQKIKRQSYLAIPTNDSVYLKIKEMLAWRKLQHTKNNNSFLLVNSWGSPINKNMLDAQLRKLKDIDPDFRIYHARYTAGWRAYSKTKNLYAAQQLLRHQNPSETINYLGIQREEALKSQREELEKIFGGVSV